MVLMYVSFVTGIYKPDCNVIYDEYTEVNNGFDFFSKLVRQWEDAAKVDHVRTVLVRSGTE